MGRMTERAPGPFRRRVPAAAVAGALAGLLALGACGPDEPEAPEPGVPTPAEAPPGDAPPPAAEAEERAGQEAREAAGEPDALELVPIRVGSVSIRVEVADDPDTRERGLMFRDSLPDDEGMLFVYPTERTLSFWMRNTPIPLDIAFADRTGRIVDIQQMEPFDEAATTSRRSAMYALEMRQGWFEDHEVRVGDRIEF